MVLLFTWIMILLCVGEKINYACKIDWKLNNILLFLFGTICIYLIKKISFKKLELIAQRRRTVLVFATLFFVVQVYIFYCIYFETGWDSGGAIIPAVRELLTHGNVNDLDITYFKRYPNNLFLVHYYYALLKISGKIGFISETYQLMPIVVCNCIISSLSCLMVFFICEKRISTKWVWTIYIWMLIVVGLSPWNVVCYSDPFALFFPICMLYIYMNCGFNLYLKYSIIILLGYIGYSTKPQVLIMLMAIIITELIRCMKQKLKLNLWKLFGTIMISGMIVCLISCALQHIYQKNGFVKDKDYEFGMTHFYMMGLNEVTNGIYFSDDVQLSDECKTYEERCEKNIGVSKERLNKYGWSGYLKLLSKKMLTNYNDGTFAWGAEGTFFYIILENPKAKLSHPFREVYYCDGNYYKYFSMMEHFLWIIMVGVVWYTSIKVLFRTKNKDNNILLLELALIGITLFELLFEARARYFYAYIPIFAVFVLLGNFGDEEGEINDKDRKGSYKIYRKQSYH